MKTGIEILIRYKDGAINDATKIIPCRIKIDRHNSWSEIVELLTKHDYPISITGDDVEMVDIFNCPFRPEQAELNNPRLFVENIIATRQ